jgi:diguanylate cyclase (GGDEF)-like protein
LRYNNKDYNIAFAIDISERIHKEQALAKKEQMLRKSQQIAHVGSWELNLITDELVWTDEVYNILGLSKKIKPDFEIFAQTIHPQDRDSVIEAYQASLKDPKKPYDIVHRVLINDQIRYVHEQCETMRDAKGQPILSVGTIRDMTDEHELNQQVSYLSNYDNLTKLPNQNLIKQELQYALKRSHKSDGLIAVCFIDLDDFKYINDVYSHEAGDQILKELATRMKEVANDTYTFGRFGADEFLVIIEGVKTPEKVIKKIDKFLDAIKVPFDVKGEQCVIGASVGISLSPNDGNSVDDLIKFADIAMHQAKDLGRNRTAFYAQSLTEKMSYRMRMLNSLKDSMANGDFTLYYQPQISLESMQVIGFEALLRWNHPIRGMVGPDEFIPFAEESGLIVPLGKWVLKSACTQANEWLEEGLFNGKIAVNVSGVQLDEGRFAHVVMEALRESGLEAGNLELEITESSLMNNQAAWLKELGKLDAMGVTLAMDDFGTGYSSLAHLRKMQLDVLKIDKSFVFDLPENSEACTMAKAIVGLAENLKMHSLAEGVESAAQLTFLKALGCEFAQGYFISKPMPASEVPEFLNHWKSIHKTQPYM